jgi:hypothetical protein
MAKKRALAVLFVVFVALGLPRMEAQEKASPPPGSEHRQLPADYWYTHVAPRTKRIEEELRAGPREPWEGSFVRPGLHGPSPGWLISRKAGYVSLSHVVDLGVVEVHGNRIALNTESPAKPWGLERPTYEVVRWGNRVYLVEPDRLVEFCNAANSGLLRTPDRFFCPFLMRDGDERKDLTGRPEVPEEFRDHLIDKPINGVVTAQLGDKREVAVYGERLLLNGFAVSLDVGKRDGVRSGMTFFCGGDNRDVAYVVSVAERRCDVLVRDVKRAGAKSVQPGARWTTVDPLYSGK